MCVCVSDIDINKIFGMIILNQINSALLLSLQSRGFTTPFKICSDSEYTIFKFFGGMMANMEKKNFSNQYIIYNII